MAQTVNAAFTSNAGSVAGGAVHALRRNQIDRRTARGVGKQPGARSAIAPVLAQHGEQARREQRVAILAALALAHFEAHAVGGALDVAELQSADLGHAQAGGVGGGEQRTRAQACARVDQTRDLIAREDLRQALGHLGHGDVQAHLGFAQHRAKQEAKCAGSLIDAGIGELPVGDEMQKVALQLLGAQRVGGAVVMFGERANRRAVGLMRAWREAAQYHRVNHPLA